jgi:signal transduction histidine kinase/ligand-binding sensor domain-containing protein/CheY-like chemotaxis protein
VYKLQKYIVLLIIFFSFFCIAHHIYAQLPSLTFNHLTIKEGLSQDAVSTVYQDKDGFMWFGSEGGLDRYDGKTVKSFYNMVRDTTLHYNQTTWTICEDSYEGLWFNNDTNGLVLYNKRKETFVRFKHEIGNPKSLSSNRVTMIFEDSKKNLWIATSGGGLNLFNHKDSTFIHFKNNPLDNKSLVSNNITNIAEDRKGILWLASPEGIIIEFNYAKNKFENHIAPVPFGQHQRIIQTPILYIDSDQKIWCGSVNGLFVYDPQKDKIEQIVSINTSGNKQYTYVTSIFEIDKNTLLIGTYYEGLFLLNPQTREIKQYSNDISDDSGLSSNQLSQMFQSVDGTLWIGSYNGGINIYNKNSLRFRKLPNLVELAYMMNAEINVLHICEMPDNTFWFGAERKGVMIYDPKKLSIQPLAEELKDFGVFSICKAHDNRIWMATFTYGLYIFDLNTRVLKKVTGFRDCGATFTKTSIMKVLEDKKHRMWFGYLTEGVDLYDPEKKTFTSFSHNPSDPGSLSGNGVYRIFEDSKGRIWFATNNGLNIYDEKSKTFLNVPIKLPNGDFFYNDSFYDVFEDSQNRIWGASKNTICLYDENKIILKSFQYRKGETNVIGQTILEDKNHYLWFSTRAGIYRFNPKTAEFKEFGVFDNLDYVRFYPASGVYGSDGLMYFGSRKGIVSFNPDNIEDNTYIPPVFITELRVNHKTVKPGNGADILDQNIIYTKKIELTYNQSNLYFEFAALSYCSPHNNQFACILEGFENEWDTLGTLNKVQYNNLKPGKYLLKVKACNNHGVWNETGTQLLIEIKPPYWVTWWFKLMVVLLSILLVFSIFFWRVHQLSTQKRKLRDKVNERTRELKEANISLSEQQEELVQQNELLSQMGEEILNQKEQLEQHSNELENLVYERTKELEKAKNRAEESDRLKSAFLANISHEIRTPMNAIMGFANLLKYENIEESQKHEFVDIINSQSETLMALIDDILDLSLIESNHLSIQPEVFCLNELLNNLFSTYSQLNKKEDLSILLNNEQHAQDIKLFTDKNRVNQILLNLMDNAYKFTTKGFIELGLLKHHRDLIIYVKDTGIGIEKNDIESIFERFRKIESKTEILYRGVGLGLSISKSLSRMLGGNLTVESEIGKGSTFSLVLPKSVINSKEPEPEPKKIKDSEDSLKYKNPYILIVEDEEANYMYIKMLLSKIGMNIFWAKNGQEAIREVESGKHFQIILMDIKMPIMNGFEATKILKSKNSEQIVIALTAYARPEERAHFMEAGFDDYLSKPVKADYLLNVFRKYLKWGELI